MLDKCARVCDLDAGGRPRPARMAVPPPRKRGRFSEKHALVASAQSPLVTSVRGSRFRAGWCACVGPRPAFNIILAGEVGHQADSHGHGPASARRAGRLSMGTDRRARRDAHPIHSAAPAQSVLRPPPAALHRDCRRRRIKPCSLAIRCGAIPFKTAALQRIDAPDNTRSPRSPWFTRS